MIPCIHEGEKRIMKILFLGKQKDIEACNECEILINASSLCEVVV